MKKRSNIVDNQIRWNRGRISLEIEKKDRWIDCRFCL